MEDYTVFDPPVPCRRCQAGLKILYGWDIATKADCDRIHKLEISKAFASPPEPECETNTPDHQRAIALYLSQKLGNQTKNRRQNTFSFCARKRAGFLLRRNPNPHLPQGLHCTNFLLIPQSQQALSKPIRSFKVTGAIDLANHSLKLSAIASVTAVADLSLKY